MSGSKPESRGPALRHPLLDSSLRGWLAWSGLLAAAYLVVGIVGWGRTLIGTEVWALYYAGQPFREQLQAIRGDLVHPPLFYLLERLWLASFGQTDNAAKALALVVNLPTFFLFTWLTRQITTYWRQASFLFSAIYLSVDSTPNQVRMYGLGLLLAVTAMVLWEKWRRAHRTKTLLAWTVVATLLLYTHLFGALTLMAFLVANWLCGPRRWAFSVAAGASAFAFLPWFLYVLPVYESRGLADNLTWVPKHWPTALGILSYGLLGEFPRVPIPLRVVLALLSGIVNLAILVLGWRAARWLWPPWRNMQPMAQWFWMSATLAGVPLALAALFSAMVTPALHWRFVLGVLPAYWLLVVLVCQMNGRWARALLYAAVFIWVLAKTAVGFLTLDIPSDVRRATLLLASGHNASDLIICEDLSNEFYWEWTHRLGRAGRIEVPAPPAAVARLSVLPPMDLEGLGRTQVMRIWLFRRDAQEVKPISDVLSRQGFVLRKTLAAGQHSLVLFVR